MYAAVQGMEVDQTEAMGQAGEANRADAIEGGRDRESSIGQDSGRRQKRSMQMRSEAARVLVDLKGVDGPMCATIIQPSKSCGRANSRSRCCSGDALGGAVAFVEARGCFRWDIGGRAKP